MSGILTHRTKPHRVSWAIWAVLGTITLSSYLAKGAQWSAMLAVAAALSSLTIFVCSLKFGVGGTSRRDQIALGLGFVGVLLWVITRQATFALLFAIAADSVGTALTLEKAYKAPLSENAPAWSMATLASLCGLLAVHEYTFAQTVYPAYALLGGLSLTLTTIMRRKAVLAFK